MIKAITHITLVVHDQDEAVKFFTEKVGLGLHKASDDPMGDGNRWVTLGIDTQPGLEIVLQATDWGLEDMSGDERGESVGKSGGIIFATNDCRGDIERLRANGVEIIMEPEELPWGIQAAFTDLYGNIHSLNQPLVS